MCTTGVMLMIWKASSAQRRERGGESLRGAVSCHPPSELGGDRGWGGSAPEADMTGWSLLRLGRKVCKSRRSGRETESGKGPRPGLVGGSGPPGLGGALSSTLRHCASRGTACRKGGHSAGSSLRPWAPQTRGSCSPHTCSSFHGSFFPCTRF